MSQVTLAQGGLPGELLNELGRQGTHRRSRGPGDCYSTPAALSRLLANTVESLNAPAPCTNAVTTIYHSDQDRREGHRCRDAPLTLRRR